MSRSITERLHDLGGARGVLQKTKSKIIEKTASTQYGTASFPSEQEAKRQRSYSFSQSHKFSILVPLYNTPERFLRQMIESVLAQTYENWELCLADGSDENHAYVGWIVSEYQKREKDSFAIANRIKYEKLKENKGIAGNTNACFAMATGDFVALFDHDDILHPSVLFAYMEHICRENADFLYCDETTFSGGSINHMGTLHFKPDFAIDNLRANNYICHFSVFSRKLAETILDGGDLLRSAFDGSQDYDLILRLCEKAEHICHVPGIYYYWRSHAQSTASDIGKKSYAIDAAKKAVEAHLERCDFHYFSVSSTRAFETIFQIRYEIIGRPMVSILIPNKDHVEDLKRCLDSILQLMSYVNYEILILENGSTLPETKKYYEEIQKRGPIRILTWDKPFNYAAINNWGAQQAQGSYLLLLNNDTQVKTPDFVEQMLMYAQRPDVGCVGAKLLYPDETIQHAGVILGLGAHRTAGHAHHGLSARNLGYMGRLCYAQDMSAVTAACLMIKKSIWDELGGMDEQFVISLNDVDFCLRARAAGYLNVWTPFAELVHYESVSRGNDLNGENAERYEREATLFRGKWGAALAAGDPYYNPNFSLDSSDFRLKIQ